jgi:hypothetical protein
MKITRSWNLRVYESLKTESNGDDDDTAGFPRQGECEGRLCISYTNNTLREKCQKYATMCERGYRNRAHDMMMATKTTG